MQTYKYNHIEEIISRFIKKNSYFILKHSVPEVQLEYKLPRKNRIIEESSGKERGFRHIYHYIYSTTVWYLYNKKRKVCLECKAFPFFMNYFYGSATTVFNDNIN